MPSTRTTDLRPPSDDSEARKASRVARREGKRSYGGGSRAAGETQLPENKGRRACLSSRE
eukprot:scaffold201170_cov33-Tisochrysis_lutea.AAC.8